MVYVFAQLLHARVAAMTAFPGLALAWSGLMLSLLLPLFDHVISLGKKRLLVFDVKMETLV